jgi:hypothetical protein
MRRRLPACRRGAMADASETLTRADALQYLRRFPAQGWAGIATGFAWVFAGNAIVLHLLVEGRLRAPHLIALVMAETLLLITIGWLQHRFVPRRDWSEQPKPLRERLFLFGFVLVWLAGAYGITLVMIDGYGDFLALLHSRNAWLEAGLQWPLLATLVFALVHAFGDHAHYRRHGGPFMSTVAHDAIARYLTLLLGGIPFAMPFFAIVIGGFKALEFVLRRARIAPGQSALGVLGMIVVAHAGFALVSLLIASGVAGWAIGYVLAKLIAELMVAAIPLVMAKVARDGP